MKSIKVWRMVVDYACYMHDFSRYKSLEKKLMKLGASDGDMKQSDVSESTKYKMEILDLAEFDKFYKKGKSWKLHGRRTKYADELYKYFDKYKDYCLGNTDFKGFKESATVEMMGELRLVRQFIDQI